MLEGEPLSPDPVVSVGLIRLKINLDSETSINETYLLLAHLYFTVLKKLRCLVYIYIYFLIEFGRF